MTCPLQAYDMLFMTKFITYDRKFISSETIQDLNGDMIKSYFCFNVLFETLFLIQSINQDIIKIGKFKLILLIANLNTNIKIFYKKIPKIDTKKLFDKTIISTILFMKPYLYQNAHNTHHHSPTIWFKKLTLCDTNL